MELRVLQYFLAVAREESITRAAEVLHITQPTLSRQLSQLEEELGTRLFERGTRHITLTPEGILLRSRAEEIVRLMERHGRRSRYRTRPLPVPSASVQVKADRHIFLCARPRHCRRNTPVYIFIFTAGIRPPSPSSWIRD